MRIGKHIGKRAKHNDKDGYVFETIGEHNGTFSYTMTKSDTTHHSIVKNIPKNGMMNQKVDAGIQPKIR